MGGRELHRLSDTADGGSEPKEPTCSAGMFAGIGGVQMGSGRHGVDPDALRASSWVSPLVKSTSAPLVEVWSSNEGEAGRPDRCRGHRR